MRAGKLRYARGPQGWCGKVFGLVVALATAGGAGCDDESLNPVTGGGGSGGAGGSGGSGGSGGGADLYPNLACDPLVPQFCGFPFPSNVYTVADATTQTGRAVSMQADVFPASTEGKVPTNAPWARSDGFSSGGPILVQLQGATATGTANISTPEDSLEADHPTVLLNAETGQRVLHWVDVDKHATSLDDQAFIIYPAEPLQDGTRYIVAIRGVVDDAGDPVEASPAFAALRDGTSSEEPSVEARRALYDDLFSILDADGIAKDDLQIAWDFTTASRQSNTDWLLHMRDEAYASFGDGGPAYTITSVDQDFDPVNIAYRIKGTMTTPLYLTDPDPGGALVFGEDGLPEPNAETPTFEVEWELLIPLSASAASPAKLLQYGHGLLGEETQIESEHFRTFCNLNNYAIFSTKLSGMASEDEGFIAEQLVNGELEELTRMFDRLHQGFLNNLLVMRMMSTSFTEDPDYGALIDGSKRFYWGISQGGISGGVLLAISPDVSRGTLEVMGQPYAVLLNRSVDFNPFFILVKIAYPDPRDQQMLLATLQMLWDRVEPNGYTKYAYDQPFTNLPDGRQTLLRVAIGDHQVSTYAGHSMARAMGAKHLDSGLRDIAGLEKVTQPVTEEGAVYVEFDFGLPPEPLCNIPLSSCEDPHGKLRKLDEAREQIHQFFDQGILGNTCLDGVCDFSDLSGCTGMEDPDLCDDIVL